METKPEITRLACSKCGEEASGPNEKSVEDAIKRHIKKKHGNQPFTARAKHLGGADARDQVGAGG